MDRNTLATRWLPVLYEDSHYLFLCKPAGLRLTSVAAQGPGRGDFIAALYHTGSLQAVHPLEDHVSGVLPLAKSDDARERLAEALKARQTETEYIAVVSGEPRTPRPPGNKTRQKRPVIADLGRLRSRRKLSLISFHHPAARTATVRADLQTIGLVILGDVRRSRQPGRAKQRPAGRLFLHRASLRFRHPYTGKTLTVKAAPPPAFDAALPQTDLLDDKLEVALASRLSCLLQPDTDAVRLFTGRPDGLAGLVAEQLGPVIVLQTHQGKFQGDEDRLRRVGKWYMRALGAKAVYHKRFLKRRSTEDDPELRSPQPLLGKPVAEELPINEGGLRFLVHPYDGYSVGLFLDQRENRRRVRELASGRRVLNAFAYTCGFSVAAAAGGAAETVSIDVSKRALEWGKRNFAANDLPLDGHLFIRSDVFEYFSRAQRQQREFDLIILDAPTFARSKKPARVFSIAKDLGELLNAALAVLAPGGYVLLSTNNRDSSATWLRDQIAEAAATAHRRFQITSTPPLPPDFAADSGYSKTLIARFP